MNRLFPLPVYTLLKIVYQNGGSTLRGLRLLPLWLIKTVLLEPLRWVELTYNKKISRHTITKDPVFILGYYRSGTSYLHEFMTKDDRFGYHTVFQMVLPELMLSTEKILSPFLDFIFRSLNIQDPVHRTPFSFRYPGEEDAAMTTALNPGGVQWGHIYPKLMEKQFRKYVLFEDISPSEKEAWERDFIFLLKKISLANYGKQLVLKSPPNTARIKLLLSLFPKAKFIMIHRNPYEVYASNKRFWKVTNETYGMGDLQSVDVNAFILDTYAKTTQRYLLEKDMIPEGQLIEVRYEDFIQKPLENMRKIYETLHLDDFGYCESKMQSYVEGQKSFVRLNHEFPANEKEQVSQKLEPYIRHWDYPLL